MPQAGLIMSLTVDDQVVDPVTAEVLFQDEARPGGHRYSLVIDGAVGGRLPRGPVTSAEGKLSRADATRLFGDMDLVKRRAGLAAVQIEWFLNTVDRVMVDAQLVRIEGDCSPVAHDEAHR